jgi:predicted transposase YbfD/YdcC
MNTELLCSLARTIGTMLALLDGTDEFEEACREAKGWVNDRIFELTHITHEDTESIRRDNRARELRKKFKIARPDNNGG